MYSDQVKLTPELLVKAMQGEKDAIPYYEQLSKISTDTEDSDMIKKIRQDEIKHLNAFTQLYKHLFRKEPPQIHPNPPQISSFKSGVKYSIIDEIEAYEMYRNILLGTNNQTVGNTFFEAMTDEDEHAARFNYMYTKLLEKSCANSGSRYI